MKKFIIGLVIGAFTLNANAQVNIGDILKAGTADANVLANPYLNPWGNMLGTSLNSGWYTSAKVHKKLGFDVTITMAMTGSPSSDKTFDIAKYSDKLASYELVPGSSTISPTVAGGMKTRPELRQINDPTGLSNFEMPDGSGINKLIMPMVTAGVGLPYGIEVKARFSPELEFGDAGKMALWGLGVQKDVKDYIPGVKHVPFLNMSVLAAYTNFSGSTGIDTDMSNNASLDISATGFTSKLLVGANFPLICFYAGAGLNSSSSDFGVLGEYDINQDGTQVVKDPIKTSFSTSSFDVNAGMRIRLGVIAFHADYIMGDYSSITAGVGISFR